MKTYGGKRYLLKLENATTLPNYRNRNNITHVEAL